MPSKVVECELTTKIIAVGVAVIGGFFIIPVREYRDLKHLADSTIFPIGN